MHTLEMVVATCNTQRSGRLRTRILGTAFSVTYHSALDATPIFTLVSVATSSSSLLLIFRPMCHRFEETIRNAPAKGNIIGKLFED